MTTKLHTISRNWTETVIDGSDFLLSLPSDSNMDVVVSTTDTVQAPASTIGHLVGYGLRKAITRELLGPGYVWAKSSGVCNVNLSTWSSDLAAILALEGLVGYWPTDPAYLYSDDAGTTLATVGGSVAYRANLISGGPAAVQSALANRPVLHKYSLSDFYWLETDDGSSTLTATTGDLGASCTVAYADAKGAVFTEGVTISSTYSTTPAVGYNSDFMIFNRALTAAEKTLITRHLTRDRDFVQRELLAISGLTGYWKADPQYLFEDSAGTTPASTSGTGPVGAWNAVNASYALGSEINTSPATWTVQAETTNNGDGSYTFTATTATRVFYKSSAAFSGSIRLSFTVSGVVSASIRFAFRGAYLAPLVTTNGDYVFNGLAGIGVDNTFYCEALTGTTATVSNISIKQVASNNAYQATTANKPILRKTPTTGVYWADANTSTSALNVALSDAVLERRNVCIYTEEFSNGAWPYTNASCSVNQTTAPGGAASADLISETSATGVHNMLCALHVSLPGAGYQAGSTYTRSIYAKKGTGATAPDWIQVCVTDVFLAAGKGYANFNLSSGTVGNKSANITATISPSEYGFYRLSVTFTATNTYTAISNRIFFSFTNNADYAGPADSLSYVGSTTSNVFVFGAQLEVGGLTDYQRIVSAPAYCTLARATAEGVTFTDNTEITSTYNIAPAYGFNTDVAIFNRALTATEKALITRYMQRSVPMLGSNLITNGTFDTNTTGWSARISYGVGATSVTDGVVSVSGNGVDIYGALVQVPITVGSVGTQFVVKARIRSVSGSNSVIRCTNASHTNQSPALVNATTTFANIEYAYSQAVALGTGILIGANSVSGTAEFDDISMRQIL